jgi:3-dehydroquinate dehydratase I
MIKIGSLELGKNPCVIGVVDAIVPVSHLLDLKMRGLDLLEIRADLIDVGIAELAVYLGELREKVALPMIGTVRENDRTRLIRLEIFKKIIPFIDCVDIELGTALSPAIIASAKGKIILVSDHDFAATPDTAALQKMVDRAVAQGAQIVKIVTMAQTQEDARRLLHFARSCAVPIVAFAMGEAGRESRIRACEYGSLFTYGYITKAVAPGQLSAVELLEAVKIAKG